MWRTRTWSKFGQPVGVTCSTWMVIADKMCEMKNINFLCIIFCFMWLHFGASRIPEGICRGRKHSDQGAWSWLLHFSDDKNSVCVENIGCDKLTSKPLFSALINNLLKTYHLYFASYTCDIYTCKFIKYNYSDYSGYVKQSSAHRTKVASE